MRHAASRRTDRAATPGVGQRAPTRRESPPVRGRIADRRSLRPQAVGPVRPAIGDGA